jgi:glutathione S-transferase
MRLYYSENSPFARKVRVVWRELELPDVEEILDSPLSDGSVSARFNPLGKVPVLVLNDDSVLIDSPLICEHLGTLAPSKELVPVETAKRQSILQCQAMADGILEAAVASVFEFRRPPAERSAYWFTRWRHAIERGLSTLEQRCEQEQYVLDLGGISVGCVIEYLIFRDLMPQDWPNSFPKLKLWADHIHDIPSFAVTAPRSV